MAHWLHLGPPERLPIRREVRSEAVLPEMTVGGETVAPSAEARLDLAVRRLSGGAEVEGRVVMPATLRCGRCLAPFTITLRGELSVRYLLDPGAADEARPYADEVDLTEPMVEALVLALPTVPLCRPGCAGLCPRCGRAAGDPQCACVPEADPRWDALLTRATAAHPTRGGA